MTRIAVEQTSRLRTVVTAHPVVAFLVMAFGLGYPLMSIPLLAQYGLLPGASLPSRLGLDVEEAASVLGVLSLLVATLGTTALLDGRAGVTALARRMLRWRVQPVWWLVATTALPVGTIVLAVFLGDSAHLPKPAALAQEALAILVALFLINLVEEAAWVGFLQTRLEERHSLLTAAALTAVPFSAIHLPLRIITGDATDPAGLGIAFVTLLVFMLFVRTLFAMVLRGARDSILLVAVTHTFFNRSNNPDGIAADILQGDARQTAALISTLLLTILLGIAMRRRLAPRR